MSLDISDVPEVVQHLAFLVEKGMAGTCRKKWTRFAHAEQGSISLQRQDLKFRPDNYIERRDPGYRTFH
jgi:hypothetical protein